MTDTQVLQDKKSLSKNGNPGFHTQDLMKLIRYASNAARKEEKKEGAIEERIIKRVEEKIELKGDLVQAITSALIRGSKDGRYYEVKGNKDIKDFRFSFIKGEKEEFEGDNIAKAPHNLTPRDVFHQRCKKHHKLVPLIEVYLRKRGYQEARIGWILICDKIQLTGEVSYEDLRKR